MWDRVGTDFILLFLSSLFIYLFLKIFCLFFFFFFATSCSIWDLSFQTRDGTHIPCIGRQSLNHWTAGEVQY